MCGFKNTGDTAGAGGRTGSAELVSSAAGGGGSSLSAGEAPLLVVRGGWGDIEGEVSGPGEASLKS